MGKNISYIIIFIAIFSCFAGGAVAASGNPLILSYAGGTGTGRSDSSFVENSWSYKYQYHVLVLNGDVAQGNLSSIIQVEERDYKTGIGYARLALSGSTYSIVLGDNVTNFSDLTLSSLSYQGASVTFKPTKDLSLTVVGGARGSGMWGADVRRDTRIRQNFTGLRSAYATPWGVDLTATYLTIPGGAQVIAYGGEYNINNIKLGMEYGSAMEGKAFRGEVKYQNNWLSLGTIYRDVDSTYVVPYDYVNYKGMKGTYSSAGIRPSNNMSINLESNSYIDRLNSDSNMANLDTRGDISYNFDTGTNIGFSGWKNDRQTYERGGVTEGEMMYITQAFYLLTRNAIYYRFQPTSFTSTSPSEESYIEKKNITGVNISLFDALHLNYELENTTKLMRNLDTTLNPTAITSRMDLFESQVMETPFYVASSVNYRQDITDKDLDLKYNSLYSDVTLKYIPGKDFSCFITSKFFNFESPDADRSARQQNDISFGLNYTFNTYFYMK